MKRIFLIAAAFLFQLPLQAQQDSVTLELAVATALQNNYDIRLSQNDSMVAAINYEYRNSAFLPTLNASATLLANNNSQNATLADGRKRTGSGIRSNNLNSSLAMNWVVFDGFRMFVLRDQLGKYLELGSLTVKNQVVNTMAEVITTYYDIVRQKQQLRNIEEQMALSQERLKLAEYKFEVGAGIKPDILQARIDFNARRAEQVNQLALIDQRKQSLNRLMNVPQTLNYKVSDTIPVQMNLALGDMIQGLEGSSPAILLAEKNIDVAQLGVKEAKAARYPTVAVTGAYNFSQLNNSTVINPAQALSTLNRGFNYGLTASIPIFNNYNVRRNIRQSELAVRFQRLNYENQQQEVNTNILNTFKDYTAQKEIMALADSTIDLARENLHIVRERYRQGVTTFIEMREAEQSLGNSETVRINARYNIKVAETELLRLKGDLVK
ncbi:TolC family protein [Paraflavisolibacter sp. H34]|uniref:TolC family protein n=1 Tax=Huijunlia imazamoxiresistens TaxID=3127457 RepID=UPI0030174C67